jgi:hypothetical protein
MRGRAFGLTTMNSNELGQFSPSLPAWVLYPVAILSVVFLLLAITRLGSRSGAFVMGAAWLRYIMSAFHSVTYMPAVAGMSANALASIGVFVVGLFTINWRLMALRFLLPFYALIAIAIISAVANGQLGAGLVTVLTKLGYLVVMTLSVYAALRRAATGAFMSSLLWAFAPVLVFQAASVLLGVSKHTETDAAAISFIGGYNHEAVFSIMIATCLTTACLTERTNNLLKNGLILVCIGGIILANYRTTLVAIVPLLLAYLGFTSLQRFPQRDRPFVVSALIVFGGSALGIVSLAFAARFQDAAVVATGDVNFFKPPDEYTVEETRLLSGRPVIWSTYIFGWLQGDMLNYVIGNGPESWADRYRVYAHNTLINALYEYGIVGVIATLFLWFSMLAAALRVRHHHRGVLVGAHITFILLNMATMPMWMIEGNLLYGIICGYTLYLLSLPRQSKQAPSTQPAPARPRP